STREKEALVRTRTEPIVEIGAEVVGDILRMLPCQHRQAILALAAEEDRKRQAEGIRAFTTEELKERVEKSAGWRWHKRIMQLRAAAAYTLVRKIANNHSPRGTAKLLFGHQPQLPDVRVFGSGELSDYLRNAGASKVSASRLHADAETVLVVEG